MLIEAYLNALECYMRGGLHRSYQKIDKNINRVKGRVCLVGAKEEIKLL